MLRISGISSFIHKPNDIIPEIYPQRISQSCKARIQHINNKTTPKNKVQFSKKQQNVFYDASIFSDSKHFKKKQSLHLNELNDHKKIQIATNRDIVIRKIKQKLENKTQNQNIPNMNKKVQSLCQIYNERKIQLPQNSSIKICFQRQMPQNNQQNYQKKQQRPLKQQEQRSNKQQEKSIHIEKSQLVIPEYMRSLMKPCVIQKINFSTRPATTRLTPYRRKFSETKETTTRMNKTAICQFRKSPYLDDLKLKIEPWMIQDDE